MKTLLIALTAAVGALFCSAPALAYRVEFLNMHDGERVAGSEVCFFEAATVLDPFGHFLASDDVRCLPADQVIDLPRGLWNFFGRAGSSLTSAHPALLQIRGEREEGYRPVPVELRPAGILDVSEVRKGLGAGESLVLLLPASHGMPGNARPVTRGEEEVLVPAGVPLIPLVVRDARPVRVGDVLTVAAGAREPLAFTPPAAGTGDVVVWLRLDGELAKGPDREVRLEAPDVAIVSAGGERRALVRPYDTPTSQLAFQIFRGVPAGRARVVTRGESWESSALDLDVRAGALTVAAEPLPLVPAGTVVVRWEIEGDPARAASPRRQTCDGPSAAPAAASHDARTLRILRCPATAAADECRVAFERELEPDVATGSVRVASLAAGVYTAELRVPPFATVRQEVYAEPGRRNDAELIAAPATLYGVVTRGGKPVRASLSIGRESFVTDDAGAFAAPIARSAGRSPISVTPCDTKEPFLHHPSVPLEANAFVAIDLPRDGLEVRVVGRGDQPIEDAVVTLAIPDAARTEVSKEVHPLPYDDERSLYVRPYRAAGASRVCAKAVGYTTRCVELRADFESSTPLVIILEETGGVRGRVVTEAPVVSGYVYAIAPEGAVLARSMIGKDGVFELPSLPPAESSYVLTAANQPLGILAVEPEGRERLLLRLPPSPLRRFAVMVAPGGGAALGRLALTVGTTRIPVELFELHQQLHGNPLMVGGERPLFVSDVAETGAIAAELLPLTPPADASVPLPAGSLPAESDLLLLR